MKQDKHEHDARHAERPITAQPIGSAFYEPPRGIENRVSDDDVGRSNFTAVAPGCFRRLPTYID